MSRGIYDKVNKVRIPIAGAQIPNVDETIIQDSSNPVAGGAVYNALQNIHIDVDSALSDTSENPVQNKVIKSALDNKLGTNDIAAWAKESTKPTYTASEVGLGNVGNYKAVSTEASQGLTDTEKSNARANIGAGTSSFSGNYNDLSNKPTIPTKTSDLTNDSNFVQDANYTHINVDSAMSDSSTNTVQNKIIKQYVDALQTAITNGSIQISIPMDPATTPTTDGAVWITTT